MFYGSLGEKQRQGDRDPAFLEAIVTKKDDCLSE